MKKVMRSFLAIAILMAGFGNIQAQNETTKKEEFKVYGNCGMCKSRIEKAAKGVDGVETAKWDKDTKMVTVTYNPEKVKMVDIEKAIAKVGHDTDNFEADDTVYVALPGCCHYDRNDEKKTEDGHDGH